MERTNIFQNVDLKGTNIFTIKSALSSLLFLVSSEHFTYIDQLNNPHNNTEQ